jgi:hypothetical protein
MYYGQIKRYGSLTLIVSRFLFSVATGLMQSRVFVSVFWTDKNRVVKITCSSVEVVLQTTKHTMIYPGLGPSLEVIALHPAILY